MPESVAGRIRIDLLTNVGKFTSDMRQAGREGMGGFKEEFERTVKGFDSQKNLTARLAINRDAWRSAMDEVRQEMIQGKTGRDLRDTNLRFYNLMRQDTMSHSIALQNQIRWKSMLPWGMSTRTELSKDAADFAAAAGEEERKLATRMGGGWFGQLRGIGSAALGRGAMGTLGRFGIDSEGLSVATKGLGLFAAAAVISHTAAANLGNEIKQLRQEAIGLGMTLDQLAAKRGLPQYGRFTEGAALSATRGWEGLKGLGANIWGGIVTGANFYSGGGTNDLETLANEARQGERAELGTRRYNAAQTGIEGLRGKLLSLGKTAEEIARSEWLKNFMPTPQQIREWDTLTEKIKKAEDVQERIRYFREEKARDKAEGESLRDAAMTPKERFDWQMIHLNTLFMQGNIDKNTYRITAERYAKDAKSPEEREAESMRKAIRERNLSPLEHYQESMTELGKLYPERGEVYDREAKRLRRQAAGELAGNAPSISLSPAMAAGSAEAYAVIARSMAADPKLAAQQQANSKLDAIDKKLGILVGQGGGAGGGNVLDFS